MTKKKEDYKLIFMTAQDIVMDAIILVAVSVQVYVLADELTDGKLSRELSVALVKGKSYVKGIYDRERNIRANTGRVIFDAMQIVEDSSNNREDG